MIVLLLTINISVQVARRRLRKKQIRAARMNVPTSGMANAIQIAHIHAMRNSSETNAYSSPSGPMNATKKKIAVYSIKSIIERFMIVFLFANNFITKQNANQCFIFDSYRNILVRPESLRTSDITIFDDESILDVRRHEQKCELRTDGGHQHNGKHKDECE